MKKILILIILVLGVSCKTKKIDWATECDKRFPVLTDTTKYRIDTFWSDTQKTEIVRVPYSVNVPCPQGDSVKYVQVVGNVECPPSKTIVKTHLIHDSIVIHERSTAFENILKKQIDSLAFSDENYRREALELRRKNGNWRKAAFISWLLAAIGAYYIYRQRKNK